MYAPEAFGVAALFGSIVGILQVISCLRYELSIILPESEEEAVNLLALSLLTSVGLSLFTAVVVYLWGNGIVIFFAVPALAPYLWLIPVAVLLNGVFLALRYWNSRVKRYGRVSIALMTNTLGVTGYRVGAGFAGYATSDSLVFSNVLGSASALLVLGRQIWRDDAERLKSNISWSGILSGARRHYKFPLYNTGAAVPQ